MNKTTLKEIILEQKEALKNKCEGIKRLKLEEIKRYIEIPHTVIIAGIRRVGKSTLLLQIMNEFYKKDCYYLNFEDERFIDFTSQDFNALYEIFAEIMGEKKVFFLDEIQNIPSWENFVRRMQDQRFKFFITGSNATLLSKELGTKLTGRYVLIELLPFSFKECLSFQKISFDKNSLFQTSERAKLKNSFNFYMEKGGMPEYLQYQKKELLVRLYEDILYRDIIARYEIKETKALREISLYLLSNLANLFTYNNLKKIAGLGSANTAKNYVEYLENSFVLFSVNLFSFSLKKQYYAPRKIYCIDNGLANSISFKFSENRGKFLENLVFLELLRRKNEVYYYKTKNNLEIDFLIKEKNAPSALIQVAQKLDDTKTKAREIKSLIVALGELNLSNGLILTEDEEGLVEQEGKTINILPVYKWLLKDEK
ncbi:ATP-binding protein [Patescibacteria group bacterium]|nr:ATP-binding protein [Patescibacteria group bacterium]MBU4580098.1 ATP-binding protein [Patescibacteria group bacterium]